MRFAAVFALCATKTAVAPRGVLPGTLRGSGSVDTEYSGYALATAAATAAALALLSSRRASSDDHVPAHLRARRSSTSSSEGISALGALHDHVTPKLQLPALLRPLPRALESSCVLRSFAFAGKRAAPASSVSAAKKATAVLTPTASHEAAEAGARTAAPPCPAMP